ncbi:hypothetical protein D9757_010689 [Collybiopsis confluens]|uniref:Uncharacterized protein n=1 Tax=Collybiopsis confluens TaxID=2823264 RepID=A0A8H5HA44_9AGAR|nr:hypothetical protein D9757_010689 [Collybiopsis confluens]
MALYAFYCLFLLLAVSVAADFQDFTSQLAEGLSIWSEQVSQFKETNMPVPQKTSTPVQSPSVKVVTSSATTTVSVTEQPSSQFIPSQVSTSIVTSSIPPSQPPSQLTTTVTMSSASLLNRHTSTGTANLHAGVGGTSYNSSSTASSSTVLSGLPSTTGQSANTSLPVGTTGQTSGAEGKNINLGAIIGGAVGGIALLALLALIALVIWDRRRRYLHHHTPSPFPTTSTTNFDGDMMVKNPRYFSTSDYSRPSLGSGFIRRLKSISSSKRSYVDRWRRQSMSMISSRISEEEKRMNDDGSDAPCLSSVLTSETPRYPRMPGILGPRTDRQMELEQKIHDLKGRLILLNRGTEEGTSAEGVDGEINQVMARIRKLEELEFSDWALERTNKAPSDIFISSS